MFETALGTGQFHIVDDTGGSLIGFSTISVPRMPRRLAIEHLDGLALVLYVPVFGANFVAS